LLGEHLGELSRAFRERGGVPYERYRPRLTDVMDGLSPGSFDEHLIDTVLPLAGELPGWLVAGTRVADLGCGTGHAVNLLFRLVGMPDDPLNLVYVVRRPA
jgi:SAM-dependent methyltransferase